MIPVRTLGCLALLAFGALTAAADLSPEDRKVLDEMEARIQHLKAEGKLGDGAAEAVPASASASAVPATAPAGCSRLKVGESAVVKFSDATSATGVGSGYGLSRPEENSYVVELNEVFVKGAGLHRDAGGKEFDRIYHERISACLKEFQGMLKSEKAGKSMVLRLANNSALPVHLISIVDKVNGAYADSETYPADIGCAAVLHEQLHLLGLADEYEDKGGLGTDGSDCRPSSPEDSVMNNPWEAAASLGPQLARGVQMCRCDKPGEACWALAEKNDGTQCPPSTTMFLKDVDPAVKTSLNVLNTAEAFVLNEKVVSTGFTGPAHTSALYPAHFRAITEPGCHDVNENYYGCVINAYRSSKDHACEPLPMACRFRSHKWLD